MAFNAQIPNDTAAKHRSWKDPCFLRDLRSVGLTVAGPRYGLVPPDTMYSFAQKIGNVNPSLCFQADVFYPNAIAALCANVESLGIDDHVGGQVVPPRPPGCRGNQIQRDFPLEPRVPVAIPLVQYPSTTSDNFLDQMDICATPILNWEKYIEALRASLKNVRKRDKIFPRFKPLTKRDRAEKKLVRWRSKCAKLPKSRQPKFEDVPTSSDESENDLITSNNYDVDAFEDHNAPCTSVAATSTVVYKKLKPKRTKPKALTMAQVRHNLFENMSEGSEDDDGHDILLNNPVKLGFLRPNGGSKASKLPHAQLGKSQVAIIKNIPKLRLEATWNYVYGGASGSCCSITRGDNRVLFVGNHSQVRQIVLEKSQGSSMLSYRVQSVWEEDISSVPVAAQGSDVSDPLSNIVHQILSPAGTFNLLGVRRGKTIDIYSTKEDAPYLLDSIPNISYGINQTVSKESVMDPLLLGMDFNPMYSGEFITIDENLQLRICDITKETTVKIYSLSKSTRRCPKFFEYPRFQYVNNASGVQFGHHGHIFYGWTDSEVFIGDRRTTFKSRAPLIQTFDLRRAKSSLSWSDQIFFNESKIMLNEYMSSLKMSSKENYYYVGTTARVFLLDARVPGQPVLKFEHGMQSAAYLDTYTDGSFEMIVAGSQRLGTTVCAITDQAHVKCFDRPDCTAANPVLHCLPRHLSNSSEFFDTVGSIGSDFSWEAEHQRAKDHNYSWTSGLVVTKGGRNKQDPHDPSGILIFTSNVYGDLFCQELEQPPIDQHRKIKVSDSKFVEFSKSWQASMESRSKSEFLKPSLNAYGRNDYSLLMEPSARGVQKMTTVRQEPFDSKKPDELVHKLLTEENEITFQEQIDQLRRYKSDIAQRCLDFWEYESSGDENEEEQLVLKQERLDAEFNMQYGNEWNEDGTRDVEFLENRQKNLEVIDFDSLKRKTSESEEPPLAASKHKKQRNESISSSDRSKKKTSLDVGNDDLEDDDEPPCLVVIAADNDSLDQLNNANHSFDAGDSLFSEYLSQPVAESSYEFYQPLNPSETMDEEMESHYFPPNVVPEDTLPSFSQPTKKNQTTSKSKKHGF